MSFRGVFHIPQKEIKDHNNNKDKNSTKKICVISGKVVTLHPLNVRGANVQFPKVQKFRKQEANYSNNFLIQNKFL